MQRILHFTRQPGSRASSSLNPQSTRYLTPLIPHRVYKLTASSPLLINNNVKLGDQDNSISREPPPANQNYGCIFPISWDNLYLIIYGKLTSKYGY